jgi:hypothetical protein
MHLIHFCGDSAEPQNCPLPAVNVCPVVQNVEILLSVITSCIRHDLTLGHSKIGYRKNAQARLFCNVHIRVRRSKTRLPAKPVVSTLELETKNDLCKFYVNVSSGIWSNFSVTGFQLTVVLPPKWEMTPCQGFSDSANPKNFCQTRMREEISLLDRYDTIDGSFTREEVSRQNSVFPTSSSP